MDQKLGELPGSESDGQWFKVKLKISNECCSPGMNNGSNPVLYRIIATDLHQCLGSKLNYFWVFRGFVLKSSSI